MECKKKEFLKWTKKPAQEFERKRAEKGKLKILADVRRGRRVEKSDLLSYPLREKSQCQKKCGC